MVQFDSALHLHLHRTPYQQGLQLGAAAAELIRDNVRRAGAHVPSGLNLRGYTAMTPRNEAWVARAYAMVLDCTQVLATGSATADGKTYLAKTRDLTRGPIQHVLLHREFDDGTFRNEIQTAGQMTLPLGVNSHGWQLAPAASGGRGWLSISRGATARGTFRIFSRCCAMPVRPTKVCR